MTPTFPEEIARCRAAQLNWSRTPLRQRLRLVRNFRHLLAEHTDELSLAVTQDVLRPADEVLATDILPTADACRYLECNAQRILQPRRIPGAQRPWWLIGSKDVVYRRSRGVVGIIGTWNYPIFLNAVQIAHALTAGNGVIWKPSELTPMLAPALHDLFLKAGFPSDLFIRLPATRDAGPQLVEADIDHLVFTGSANVGRQLAMRLGERLISSTLELSGCDAMIVGSDADIPMAAKAAWFGSMLNRGQTCLAVRRIFVDRSRYAEFLDQLRPLTASKEPQPLMLLSQAAQAERLVRSAINQGARVLGSDIAPKAEDDPPRFPRTVVTGARAEMAICQEASFAPITSVMAYDNMQTVVDEQEKCPFALGSSIFMRDQQKAMKLAEALGTGMVTINDVLAQTAHPATPFGGRRASGWGVTQGAEGLLEMTVPQVISERTGTYRPHFDAVDGAPAKTVLMLKGILQLRHGKRWRQRWDGLRQLIRGAWESI